MGLYVHRGGVTGAVGSLGFLPGMLSLLFSQFLSLSLSFFLSDISLFARLLGCPSAVVINTLPVAAVCFVVRGS